MPPDQSPLAITVARIGFVSSMIFGTIQICLTHFVNRNIFGTYKLLITIFAAFGMIFSIVEVIVYPNVQTLDYGALYFSLSRPFGASVEVSKMILISYCWFYAFTISFLAVMFIYRYWAVFNQHNLKFFEGYNIFIWISYCSFFGLHYCVGLYYCLYFDDISFNYFKEDVFQRYGVQLDDIPAMAMVAFDPDTGKTRWRNVSCIVNIFLILGLQYCIMMGCGWKMHWEMEQKITHFSPSLRKHHQQFFRTLVVQICAPTFTLFAPLIFIICLPLFNIKVDLSVGVLVCGFTLYPAIDAVIMMCMVSDYRETAIKIWREACKRAGWTTQVGATPQQPEPLTEFTRVSTL